MKGTHLRDVLGRLERVLLERLVEVVERALDEPAHRDAPKSVDGCKMDQKWSGAYTLSPLATFMTSAPISSTTPEPSNPETRVPRDKPLRSAIRLDECVHRVERNRNEFDKHVCRPGLGNGPVVDELEGFLLGGDDECFLGRRSHGCGDSGCARVVR